MNYNYTTNISTKNFEIKFDLDKEYGYFEHNQLGDECSGGIWLNSCMNAAHEKVFVVTDYDGVFMLPTEVKDALLNFGILLDWSAHDEWPEHKKQYSRTLG